MEEVINKNNVIPYIETLVSSLEISLLDIFNKFFYCYNFGLERVDEFTIMGIKGRLKSRQEENKIISSIIIEYGILKEPYSEPKEAHEIQWKISLDKEISYNGIIKQLEDNFEVIIEKINSFDLFALEDDYSISEYFIIEIDVKIGAKSFHRSLK